MIIAHSESVGMAAAVMTVAATAFKSTLGPARLLPWLVCRALTGSVLRKLPAAAAVTFTVTVHVPGVPTGIVEFVDKLTVFPPAVALTTPPPQVVVAFGVGAITTPAGNVSVSGALRVARLPAALVKVMVRVETPPGLMVDGLKTLESPTPPEGGTPAHPVGSMVLLIKVAEPFRAKALPAMLAALFKLMLVSARIFPTNVVVVSRVAELPTCQNTLHFVAPPVTTTDEPGPVVSVLPILKTQTAEGPPLRVSGVVPVNPIDDAEQ